jgi:Na+/proline symporter
MIDAVQAVLLFVIVLLAIILIVLGVQVFFILREFRKTIKKTNRILDTTDEITTTISQPLSFLSTFLVSTRSLSTISKVLKTKKRDEEEG